MQLDHHGVTPEPLDAPRTCRVWDGQAFVEMKVRDVQAWRPPEAAPVVDEGRTQPALRLHRASRGLSLG